MTLSVIATIHQRPQEVAYTCSFLLTSATFRGRLSPTLQGRSDFLQAASPTSENSLAEISSWLGRRGECVPLWTPPTQRRIGWEDLKPVGWLQENAGYCFVNFISEGGWYGSERGEGGGSESWWWLSPLPLLHISPPPPLPPTIFFFIIKIRLGHLLKVTRSLCKTSGFTCAVYMKLLTGNLPLFIR